MWAGVFKRGDIAVFKAIKNNIFFEELSGRKVATNIFASRSDVPAVFQEQGFRYLQLGRSRLFVIRSWSVVIYYEIFHVIGSVCRHYLLLAIAPVPSMRTSPVAGSRLRQN